MTSCSEMKIWGSKLTLCRRERESKGRSIRDDGKEEPIYEREGWLAGGQHERGEQEVICCQK